MNKTMSAAVLIGPKHITIKEMPVPELQPGMIEIDVSACGVCGSDVHMWQAGEGWGEDMHDFVMGHEFCGIVTNPGDSDFKIGERVVFWANLYCGKCDMCSVGSEHLCREVNGTNYIGFVCNGAYAEKFVGKAKNAYRIPDSVSDIAAALIDPLMVAYHAVRKANVKLHDKVLVVGSGIIGQLIGGLLKKMRVSYLAMSKVNDCKIASAKRIGDFDEYFDGNDPDIVQKMKVATNGGFDVAFEAVGSGEALATCIDGVKPGAEVIMIGNSMTESVPFNLNRTVLHEIKLLGSVSCTKKEFEETIDLIATKIIEPEKYVTNVVTLHELQHSFERLVLETDPVVKIVVKP